MSLRKDSTVLFHSKYAAYHQHNDHQTRNGQIRVVGFIKQYFKGHLTVDVPGVIKFDVLSRDYQLCSYFQLQ